MEELADELEFLTEAFYWFAFRLRNVLRLLPGLGSFDGKGVRDVRNHLLEHPEKGQSGVIWGGFGFGGECGPVLKAVRRGDQTDVWKDAGLIERGWQGPKAFNDGFRNHGQRVSTMVGIAKALGYPGSVGAMQANFGTPFENGIYDLEVSLAEARAQQCTAAEDTGLVAEIERLAADLAAAIGLAKPGAAPDDSWATVDLDVNDDLVVDQRDLRAARAETAADREAQP
jgi:hypothetical protein